MAEKSGFDIEESGLLWLNTLVKENNEVAEPVGDAAGERTVNMSKSSRKLNKKKEKATKVELKVRAAGLREQMGEQMEALTVSSTHAAVGSLARFVLSVSS